MPSGKFQIAHETCITFLLHRAGLDQWVSLSVVPEPAALTSSGNMLEMQILRPYPTLSESATLGPGTSIYESLW